MCCYLRPVARTRARRAHRSWPQRLLLGVNSLLVVACLGAAYGLSTARTKYESIPVVDVGSSLSPPVEVSEPRNFLIIGTDSAARLAEGDAVTEGRSQLGTLADVVMILRVDPRDGSVRLLSIPRDSRLSISPGGGMDRINTAISGADGPKNLVRTIKRNFGIPIDNYVEIDFQSFRDLVEVLGGVPVYFATEVRDKETGLEVVEPGCRMLDPVQALAYARSRHFEYKEDGRWRTDGTGDLGRITRQQDFIKRALRRAADKGLRNPSTAVGVVNAAAGSVTLDETLDVGTIVSLLGSFQSFNPDSLESVQVPTVGGLRGGVAYQDVVWDEAEPLLVPFRGVDPGAPLQPRNVIVDVSGPDSRADELAGIAGQLDAAAFDAEVVEDGSRQERTSITYGPNGREAAILLATQLDIVPEFDLDEDLPGARVVLEVGSDFGTVRTEAIPVDQLPADLLPPATTTTDPTEGTSTTDAPSTTDASSTTDPGAATGDGGSEISLPGITTTTAPGVVPTDPAKAATCR